MLRLRRYDGSLPGGYPYVQPETGMKFGGNTAWRAQVRVIWKHRIGNGLPRATMEEVADDLEAYQCRRLPKLCDEKNASLLPKQNQARVISRGCGHCGGRRKKV